MAALNLITPLVACLDPGRKFPIINGERGVNRKLMKLGLVHSKLEEQVMGFIGLIGKFGLGDAFAVDTMTEERMEKITRRSLRLSKPGAVIGKGKALPILDDAERKAVQKSGTIIYRRRHNTMTTRLRELLTGIELTQGPGIDSRYDILIQDYDRQGRDLLIEVKPDPDKGSIRIAIGQLLDYRRFVPNQVATDLAILTISRPPQSHIELMQDLQITSLWFADEKCQMLTGEGKVWKRFEVRLNSGSH